MKIFFDNIIVVFYINVKGGIKFFVCNDIISEIWLWCIENKIWFIVVYIFGV